MYSVLSGQQYASSCSTCPVGKASAAAGATSCSPCSLSTYASVPGQATCSVCPNSTISDIGASSYYNASASFFYTNGLQLYTVPTGVASIRVDAYGAVGAPSTITPPSWSGNSGQPPASSYSLQCTGGFGGFIASMFDVSQGRKLYVDVGSWGANVLPGYGNQLRTPYCPQQEAAVDLPTAQGQF
jgi:Tyrosine-protein kinase ephrin type A/B receptor-like